MARAFLSGQTQSALALDGKGPQILYGEEAPTNQTVSVAGQLYVDTNAYEVYVCRRVYNGLSIPIYMWSRIITKAEVDGTVGSPKLRNQYFVAKASYVADTNDPTVNGQICWLYG